METRQAILTEFMRLLRREYTNVSEIEKLTKELEEALNRSDRESVHLVLDMRQKEMEEASAQRRAVEAVLESVDSELREELRFLMKNEQAPADAGFEEKQISSIGRQIRNSLERTRNMDRVLSRRIAGKDSYYH